MTSSKTELPLRSPKEDKPKVSRDKKSKLLRILKLSKPLLLRKLKIPLPQLPPRPTSSSDSEVEMMPNSLAEEEADKVEEVLQRLEAERM